MGRTDNVLYASPVWRDGKLYRGVAATNNPDSLLKDIDRDKWILLYLCHSISIPKYHPEVDLYMVAAADSEACPEPQLHLVDRHFSDPALYLPLGISKQFDVVFNCSWVWFKRHELWLDTLSYAVHAGRPISCLCFGYHWHADAKSIQEKTLAESKNRQLPIEFMDTDFDPSEVNRRHNLCRLSVMCSAGEGGPRVMSEVMLAGLPYVCTRDTRGGSPADVNDQNGRLCDAAPESIANAVWHVLDHLDEYRPRDWAIRHMSLPAAMTTMRCALDKLAAERQLLVNSDELTCSEIDWRQQLQLVQNANASC